MNNKKKYWRLASDCFTKSMSRVVCCFAAGILLLSCSDWNDMGTETIPDETNRIAEEGIGIAFNGSVVPSQQATRADATIVKLGDTQLPTTANSTFYAGLFGCYTGKYTWGELVALKAAMNEGGISDAEYTALHAMTNFSSYATKGDLETAAPNILKDYYTPNLLYNAKATIGENGTLAYEPLRFWPNTKLPSPATGHEYCTFWAYYPYNPTAEIGDYGITLIPENIGEGTGMGRVKFTMQPDAANQNDFMISEPVINCNRDTYPLVEGPQGTYTPEPVRLRFHHMLSQVRIYAYIRGNDRMVYQDTDDDGEPDPADATWLATQSVDNTIKDIYGNTYTIKSITIEGGVATAATIEQTDRKNGLTPEQITSYGCGDLDLEAFLALGLKVPDESQCERWQRTSIWDVTHKRRRAMLSYQMEFNNIKTTTTFYPNYGTQTTIGYDPATTLGSATVTDYIMNPYWYKLSAEGQRTYLDDDYMFGYFEDQDASKAPESNALAYTLGPKNLDATKSKHYNFAQSNILLMVPQVLDDDDVPHIVLTAKGEKAGDSSTEYSARLTINMLKMNIEWKSGIIYCYGILDDLRPGDDIVRGPESITTIFDTSQNTDQW